MTRGVTELIVGVAAVLVPRRLRDQWRREWQGELSYGWQQCEAHPSVRRRWQLTLRASSALTHALWLRAQELTMDRFLHDIRFAFRLMRRQPAASLVAVLTLALGIGANTAIFSLVNTVLVRPLPVAELGRLVVIREDLPGLNLLGADLAPIEVLDLDARDDLFVAVAGVRDGNATLTGGDEAIRVRTATTVGDFAGVFAVQPHLGRFYDADESQPGRTRIAVVSYGLWQQLSGGDPAFVGRTIVVDDVPLEVVGIMPPEFRHPGRTQVWRPFEITDQWRQNRGSLFMATTARLAPGVTAAQLAVGLDGEGAAWNEAYTENDRFAKVLTSVGLIEHLAGPLRLILLVLLGAVMFVLLIAAANVASLQLVRTAGRVREIAVRGAIGASPGRIFRQFLIESVLLSVAGGIVGLGLGILALRLLEGWAPATALSLTDISLDGSVLAFTAGVTVLAAITFGTVPALRGAHVSPEGVLREQGRGLSTGLAGQRLLKVSVVVQVALALVLFLGSGLMIRTLVHLFTANPGFESAGLVTARVSLPAATYSTEQRAIFFDELITRVSALPPVTSAAIVTGLPFAGGNDSSPFDIPSRPAAPGEPERHAEASAVSADYFATMGIPLVQGRGFDGTERAGGPIAGVIDQTFAEQFFPDEDPVGQRIVHYFGEDAPVTIVGVAGRVDHDEIGDAPKALVYYPVAQQPWMTSRAVVIRTSASVDSVVAALRAIVSDLDADVPVDDIMTMDARIADSLGARRLAMLALGGFSALSLLLAMLGVYGVMRYTTSQRTREIGIRLALGARPAEVIGMVVRQGALVAVLGVAIGTAVALAATRLMEGMLFGVSPRDPATFVAGAVLLGLVTVVAALLPAVTASRVDPVSALRID